MRAQRGTGTHEALPADKGLVLGEGGSCGLLGGGGCPPGSGLATSCCMECRVESEASMSCRLWPDEQLRAGRTETAPLLLSASDLQRSSLGQALLCGCCHTAKSGP